MYKRRNATAKDGHLCDSISEVIIDNWLSDHNIGHIKNASYPNTHHKADWAVRGVFIEYFGLAEDSPRYDRIISKKKLLCRRLGIPLVEIYPKDIYPHILLEQKFKDSLFSVR